MSFLLFAISNSVTVMKKLPLTVKACVQFLQDKQKRDRKCHRGLLMMA